MTDNSSSIKKEERKWQDCQGGTLQQRAYERAGTRVMMEGQFARVAEMLELKSGMRLLDLGCGAGLFLVWLAGQTKLECHGIDLSFNSLKSAQGAGAVLDLTLGDAESLPYKNGSFDRIACNGAAHHLIDLRSALREMHRVLAPGGILVMYEPNANPLTNVVRSVFLSSNKYESPADLAHKDAFTPKAVHATLLETGFTGIRTAFYDFLAYPLSGMYMDLPLSRSKTAMRILTRLESRLERFPLLKPICDLFAWRLLVVAAKAKSVL
jgi:SAM-dependent methyltransferase